MKFNITFAASKTGHAGVVELVDTLDLGSSVCKDFGGSSPFARTKVGKPPYARWLFSD